MLLLEVLLRYQTLNGELKEYEIESQRLTF